MPEQQELVDKTRMYLDLARSAIYELIWRYATNEEQINSYLDELEQQGRLLEVIQQAHKATPNEYNPANVVDNFCAFRWVAMCNPARNPVTLRWIPGGNLMKHNK